MSADPKSRHARSCRSNIQFRILRPEVFEMVQSRSTILEGPRIFKKGDLHPVE
jgi:hypothetical protein